MVEMGEPGVAALPPGPDAALPPADTRRWVARRKAAVVEAIRRGELTAEEACSRYELSEEELASWQRLVDRHGARALRVTHLKRFRETQPPLIIPGRRRR